MFPLADSSLFNGESKHLINFPESLEKIIYPLRMSHDTKERVESIPVDVVDSPKEYIFYMDLPGFSKSDIQVTVEDEKTLVVRSSGKRKHEDGEEEGCKYIRLERSGRRKLVRKFRLPDDADACAVEAKCENGVLEVVVGKYPQPTKGKTIRVSIS